MRYVADMGSDFEKGGRSVSIEAPNAEEALKKATACLSPDEFVYEIWTLGTSAERLHCIWDFMQGFRERDIIAGLCDGWNPACSMLPLPGKDDRFF